MAKLTDYLNNLERVDLITLKKNNLDLEYAFKHVFTQESVYGSLLRSDRRQIHQRVGEILENLLADTLDDGDTALLLAYHFEQSSDKDRALKYLRCAADSASANYANQEAKALYSRALTLLDRDDYLSRWQLLASQEHILNRLGERDQQADILTQMQTLAELMQDDECLALTHNRRIPFNEMGLFRHYAELDRKGGR